MLFPSNIFLFCFFPIILFLYYGIGSLRLFTKEYKTCIAYKNLVLLVGSLFFYAYGEKWYVLLLLVSIVFNYFMGIMISKNDEILSKKQAEHNRKRILIISVIFNLGILFCFKYLDYVILNINRLLGCEMPVTGLKLPIGISFFTFQAMSYVIDVYRNKAKAQMNPLYVGLYIALFPQLIAGPIVRYESIALQMEKREESQRKFSEGILRFVAGLGKKVLLADGMALFADRIFGQIEKGNSISMMMAWLGAIAYTLQIYYDFSGYSDMAIGLGKMFGFTFEENFNYPYISKNITDFWRRWHISLSTWFRDYLYIPLGGNRVSKIKMYRNLFIVWMLTGIWHGAGWTFVLWGFMYFIILSFEKLTGLGKKWELPVVINHLYSIFVVIIGWTIFRSKSLALLVDYLKPMFGQTSSGIYDATTVFYIKDNWILFAFAFLFATPLGKVIAKKEWLYQILMTIVFILSLIYIWKGGYSPFIYFSF